MVLYHTQSRAFSHPTAPNQKPKIKKLKNVKNNETTRKERES